MSGMFYTFFTCVSPYLGVERGQGLGYNLLISFSTLGSSKMNIFETDFFDIPLIYNDRISHVKHALDPFHVFFTLFAC